MELEGRSAIVTGGAGGLGAATVRRLAAAGMRVVVFDRALEPAELVAKELGTGARAIGGDITDDADVHSAIAAARELGRLSVVVNVAGGGVDGGRIVGRGNVPHDKDVYVRTLMMNVTGTFNVSRLTAAAMAVPEPETDGQRGVIVNTGSIAGIEGQAGQIAYGSSKAAVLGMTLPMARDLAPLGIRVCAIAPGTMETALMQDVSDEVRAKIVEFIVFPKRMGYPEEFASLVETIARNDYLNGENIRLDGALRFPPK
jgi:NAD(P)-dependent dehydrogenase (short-subunit alcohol dehydrogenase family)